MTDVRLGLRENLGQFSLLVVVNAFVGAMVGMERSMVARGEILETHLEDLPAETFPLVRAIEKDVADYEYVWSFGVETLIAGLRARR